MRESGKRANGTSGHVMEHSTLRVRCASIAPVAPVAAGSVVELTLAVRCKRECEDKLNLSRSGKAAVGF
jgi:hypothetical protein